MVTFSAPLKHLRSSYKVELNKQHQHIYQKQVFLWPNENGLRRGYRRL